VLRLLVLVGRGHLLRIGSGLLLNGDFGLVSLRGAVVVLGLLVEASAICASGGNRASGRSGIGLGAHAHLS
jgi:hypothetical protein